MRLKVKLRKGQSRSGGQRRAPGPRPLALIASAFFHAAAVALLFLLGTPQPAPLFRGTVVMLPPRTEKLIWYFPSEILPRVGSTDTPSNTRPKVELTRPGQVISAEGPVARKQLVWMAPPKLRLEQEVQSPNLLAFLPAPARPQPKKFVPQNRPAAVSELPKVLPQPVALASPAPAVSILPLASPIAGPPKPEPRRFVPPAGTAPPKQMQMVIEAAPSIQAATQQPSIAIVSLEPARPPEIRLPDGSRAGRFSAGPESGSGAAEHSASLVVPGLNIDGNRNAAPVVVQTPTPPRKYQEPTATDWARATSGKDSRRIARSMMSAALHPGARVISPVVESHFSNRPVYTTSFETGSDASVEWVIWFAEQKASGQFTTIRPPVPWNRDSTGQAPDPSEGRFAALAVIGTDGRPQSVAILNAADPVTNDLAIRFVSEWSFLPALRNGETVAVDVLIQVNFRHKR